MHTTAPWLVQLLGSAAMMAVGDFTGAGWVVAAYAGAAAKSTSALPRSATRVMILARFICPILVWVDRVDWGAVTPLRLYMPDRGNGHGPSLEAICSNCRIWLSRCG